MSLSVFVAPVDGALFAVRRDDTGGELNVEVGSWPSGAVSRKQRFEIAITWNVTSFDAASCEKVAGHHDEHDSDHLDRDSI